MPAAAQKSYLTSRPILPDIPKQLKVFYESSVQSVHNVSNSTLCVESVQYILLWLVCLQTAIRCENVIYFMC